MAAPAAPPVAPSTPARRAKPEPLRPFRVAWLFFRVGVMSEVQYRLNFFLQLLQSVVALGTGLAVLAIVFSHTSRLAGWSRPELLAVMGIHVLMGGFIHTFIQPNMERLMEDVRKGTLDYVLTKPEDGQVVVSVREIRIWQGVDVLLGTGVLVVALVQLHRGVGAWGALGFAAALLLGAVMVYCFWLIVSVGVFWIIRLEWVGNLFDGIYATGRWPIGVYPIGLRASLTFLVPVAFAVTVPAQALTGRLNMGTLGIAAAFAAVLLVFTRWFWKRGLRRYSGASA
jgi:viologen exporter family transport system permease protein